MAVFSTNQVRQLYVAKALKGSITKSDAVGTIAVKSDTTKTNLSFPYMGYGGQTRSDLISVKNIETAKATDASALVYNLSKVKLVLDYTINGGAPVGGQEYILRIAFRDFIGTSPEDQYFKYGMVSVYAGLSASNFYKTLILSLVKNFSMEVEQLLTFYIETGGTVPGTAATLVEVTSETKASDLTGVYTGIVLEEKPQEWILGAFPQVPVNFAVQPLNITTNGDERIWGIATTVASTAKIEDGKKMADLEYFCMGERGDTYRNMGFPNVIHTKYLVDPSIKYNTIDLGYFYQGSGEGVQKSQKTITLLVPKIGANNSVSNVLTNSIITAINTATGLTIAALDTSA